MTTLTEAAVRILTAAQPADKVSLSLEVAADWFEGRITDVGRCPPPERPNRPEKPEILPPNKMPKRTTGGKVGMVGLLHALAHIEFNAIDLAWDIIARFADQDMPKAFFDDWVQVAKDEAEHFRDLNQLMGEMDAAYGDLPAHDGLWDAARKTAHDLYARLAVVPMTLEARALDTAPTTVHKLAAKGDTHTAPVLQKIVDEEIDHVAAGTRWFKYLCQRDGRDAPTHYHSLIHDHFPGGLKRPFNHQGRGQAGMEPEFYEPLGRD